MITIRGNRGRVSLALATIAATAVSSAPIAQADPQPSNHMYWSWGGQGPAVCQISAYLDSTSMYVNGKRVVRARGYFRGCEGGFREVDDGDGDLTVTGTNTAGNKYGGSTGWCPTGCSKTVYIPWSGKGYYKLRVSYGDTGYLIRNGTDPTIRLTKNVTS